MKTRWIYILGCGWILWNFVSEVKTQAGRWHPLSGYSTEKLCNERLTIEVNLGDGQTDPTTGITRRKISDRSVLSIPSPSSEPWYLFQYSCFSSDFTPKI